MKKAKLIIAVILFTIGFVSFVFIPGGFIKTSYQNMSVQTEQTIELPIEVPMPIPRSLERTSSELRTQEVEKSNEEILAPTSIYVKGKSVFYEVYGILKDILSLIATIYGIMIAKKTLLEKKKT
jgi:predicted PurR-regulated permease PerM